jgi:hypothetical protein
MVGTAVLVISLTVTLVPSLQVLVDTRSTTVVVRLHLCTMTFMLQLSLSLIAHAIMNQREVSSLTVVPIPVSRWRE